MPHRVRHGRICYVPLQLELDHGKCTERYHSNLSVRRALSDGELGDHVLHEVDTRGVVAGEHAAASVEDEEEVDGRIAHGGPYHGRVGGEDECDDSERG